MANVTRLHLFTQLYKMIDGVAPFAAHLPAMALGFEHSMINARLVNHDNEFSARLADNGLNFDTLREEWHHALAPLKRLQSHRKDSHCLLLLGDDWAVQPRRRP
jgi:hypothetical protein